MNGKLPPSSSLHNITGWVRGPVGRRRVLSVSHSSALANPIRHEDCDTVKWQATCCQVGPATMYLSHADHICRSGNSRCWLQWVFIFLPSLSLWCFYFFFALATELKRTTVWWETGLNARAGKKMCLKVDALFRYSGDQLVLSLEPF